MYGFFMRKKSFKKFWRNEKGGGPDWREHTRLDGRHPGECEKGMERSAQDRMQVASRFWLLEQPRSLDSVESLTNKQMPGSKVL